MRGIFFTLLCSISLSISAQNITVRGTVSDAAGEPLIGVTVQVEGESTGTVTDFDGKFTLLNVPSDASLLFTYVGMQPQTIKLNGRTTLSVTMTEDTELLEEVIVVGFGQQKKGYRYLIAELGNDNDSGVSFRLFDENNYWSQPALYDFGSERRVVVDLHSMYKQVGDQQVRLDPSHIYIIGFWSSGNKPIVIKNVYLSDKIT